jgi:hypothetical protein
MKIQRLASLSSGWLCWDGLPLKLLVPASRARLSPAGSWLAGGYWVAFAKMNASELFNQVGPFGLAPGGSLVLFHSTLAVPEVESGGSIWRGQNLPWGLNIDYHHPKDLMKSFPLRSPWVDFL